MTPAQIRFRLQMLENHRRRRAKQDRLEALTFEITHFKLWRHMACLRRSHRARVLLSCPALATTPP